MFLASSSWNVSLLLKPSGPDRESSTSEVGGKALAQITYRRHGVVNLRADCSNAGDRAKSPLRNRIVQIIGSDQDSEAIMAQSFLMLCSIITGFSPSFPNMDGFSLSSCCFPYHISRFVAALLVFL